MGNSKKKMRNILTLIIIQFIANAVICQVQIEKKDILNTYPNGKVMRERIKFIDNDTIVENVYYEDGVLNSTSHRYHNQLNGKKYTYNFEGLLIFEETYKSGKLSGKDIGYHINGQIAQIVYYENDNRIDTAKYFSENGKLIRLEIFHKPTPRYSYQEDKTVIIYQGKPVYSYEVNSGLKSEYHTVIDKVLYAKLQESENMISILEKGQLVFRQNCAACHKMDKKLIGPALNCVLEKMSQDDIKRILYGRNNHPITKLNTIEWKELMEYLKTCP